MLINGKYRCAGCTKLIKNASAICECGCDNGIETNPVDCLQIGTLIKDTYVIGKVIGEGGFGITYVGWDRDLDKKVAIKEFFMKGYTVRDTTVSPEVSATAGRDKELFETNREKFINEAKILASFTEEQGIVTVYKFFKENNTGYIVMEYIEGISLKEYLKKKGKITLEEAMGIIGPVMNSLAKVHGCNLIHRDISPDNIMITADGSGKLIDFGAARDISRGNKSLSVVLKHGYAPMEQYQTRGNQGPWTDVYALTATLYKCITGKVPVEATNRVMKDTLEDVRKLNSNCSDAVSLVISKGLSIDVEERYQTVIELENALRGALNEKVSRRRKKDIKENKSDTEISAKGMFLYTVAIIITVALMIFCIAFLHKYIYGIIPLNDLEKETTKNNAEVYNVTSDAEKPTVSSDLGAFSDTNVGDIITFGHYDQDKNVDNGQEEIEWIVLAKDDEKLLLISKYILDIKNYDTLINAKWKYSEIRQWLNNDFINEAFLPGERNAIISTQVETLDDSKRIVSEDGITSDFIFLLSSDEIDFYFNGIEGEKTTYQGFSPTYWRRDQLPKHKPKGVRPACQISILPEKNKLVEDSTVCKNRGEHAGVIEGGIHSIGTLSVGEKVTFGHYDQDDNVNNGLEEIEWTILEKDESKALLISNDILATMEFSTENDCKWENSLIRKWLNSEFIEQAFSDEESACILTETLRNEDNYIYGTDAGADTDDKIFVLSMAECKTYFYDDKDRVAQYREKNLSWWTRSPGAYDDGSDFDADMLRLYGFSEDFINYVTYFATYVSQDSGEIIPDGAALNKDDFGVRPALWVEY